MRLLYRNDQGALSLTKYLLEDIPPYAILSHNWGKEEDEVTYVDISENSPQHAAKPGYAKLDFCLRQAERDGYKHVWIDTCCIKRGDQNELSRSIHSMYQWYMKAAKCYVYLADICDVSKRDHRGDLKPLSTSRIVQSRWFERGWTLQELLAPKDVRFFSKAGSHLGTREELAGMISARTGIPEEVLVGSSPVANYTRKVRLSWVSNRKTKYPEDKAYCLIGLLGVSMPLAPGETEKQAMSRLRDAIIKSVRDDLDDRDGENVEDDQSSTAISRPDHVAPNTPDEALQKERRTGLLNALKFADMRSRRSQVTRPYLNTCQWLLSHTVMQQWTDEEAHKRHHGLLWIKGKPGVGKSTLVKYADANMIVPKGALRIAFYFHARGTILQKSINGMYRSLLYQLLEKQVVLQDMILDEFQSSTHAMQSETEWERHTLQQMLSYAFFKSRKRRVYCFVDALDECNAQEVQQMIDLFETISQDCVAAKMCLRICLASRHYPIIRIRTDLELDLDKVTEHQTDLQQYVDGRLQTDTDPAIDDINQQIVRKANGIFMWTVLVVDILNNEYADGALFNVQDRLDSLPPELSALFRDIIDRDHGRGMDRLRFCLQWLLFARRPLTHNEFYCVMATHSGPIQALRWDPKVTDNHMRRLVSSCSKGLAEVSEDEKHTVQFIHESVRDYLLKDDGLLEIFPEFSNIKDIESKSHQLMSSVCQVYLDVDISEHLQLQFAERRSFAETAELRKTLATAFPLIAYAQETVIQHAELSTDATHQRDFVAMFHIHKWRLISNLFERIATRRIPQTSSLWSFACAAHDASTLFGRACEDGDGLSPIHMPHDALYIALAHGHKTVLRTMLGLYNIRIPAGVIESLPSKNTFSGSDRWRPLLWAYRQKHFDLAMALVTSRSFLDVATTTEIAVPGLQPDLRKYDAPSPRTVALSGIFLLASQSGNVKVVSDALSLGVRLSTKTTGGMTAVMLAASHGHCNMIEFLVSHGASVDEKDISNQTALLLVARLMQTAPIRSLGNPVMTVRCLLDSGANPNFSNYNGYTPLMIFSQIMLSRPYAEECLRVLIAGGADMEATDQRFYTTLGQAVSRGDMETTKILLRLGADVNGFLLRYQTISGASVNVHASMNRVAPIMLASHTCNADMARLLLSHGAITNTVDCHGVTALMTAGRHCDPWNQDRLQKAVDLLMCLFEFGAELETRDKLRKTALMHVVESVLDDNRKFDNLYRNKLKLVSILVAAGANVYATDVDGSTPLTKAREFDHDLLCMALLEPENVLGAVQYRDAVGRFAALKEARKKASHDLCISGT